MQKQFTRILVPVSFNRNTALAADKAVQIANRFNCDIHLLYVQAPEGVIPFLYEGFFSRSFSGSPGSAAASRLKTLEESCKTKLQDGLQVTSAVMAGNWYSVMKETIITEHIDLVIIPRHRRKFTGALIQRINLNRLSQQAQCPVLTVTRRFNISHLQNIVVPVSDFLPIKKLTIATYLCRELNGRIYLVGSGGNTPGGRSQRKCLIKAYHLLNDYGHVKIHCSLPDDYDNPANTLAYARKVQADLIVVNTGKESLLKGWWSKLMGKYLYKESDIPVLTISPPAVT